MPQHRRILLAVLVALSLLYVFRPRAVSRSHGSLSWIRRGRDDDDVRNATLGVSSLLNSLGFSELAGD